jgi:hypothetical protein
MRLRRVRRAPGAAGFAHCDIERRKLVLVFRIQVGAAAGEKLHEFIPAPQGRTVQRRLAIVALRIDIGAGGPFIYRLVC